MTLQANLEVAAAAIAAVNALNYQSSNRGAALDGLSAELSGIRGTFANFLFGTTYQGMLEDVGRGVEPTGLDTFVAPVAVARRLRFANCEARAGLALIYAAQRHAVRPLQLFSVGEDHAFLVIGRTAGAANAPAGWNAEAVICDPWARDYYAKANLDAKLAAAPVAAVVGVNPALRQYFEHAAGAWPPAALRHYLDQAGLNDIWR